MSCGEVKMHWGVRERCHTIEGGMSTIEVKKCWGMCQIKAKVVV